MTAFVYILVHEDKPRFKIGKAVDIGNRISQLKLDKLNLERSIALQVECEEAAINLEKALHRCFDKWRISIEDLVAQEGAPFDGYTEWFSMDCFDRLMLFVDQNAELFDFSKIAEQSLAELLRPASKVGQASASQIRNQAPRVKKVITLEEIAGAANKAKDLLPTLMCLLDHCDAAALNVVQPGKAELQGQCSPANAGTAQALLGKLCDESLYDYSLGGFSIFSGFETWLTADGHLVFGVDHIWPEENSSAPSPLIAAARTLAQLPVPVHGWGI